jgi:hypothetical protein
MNAPTLQSNTIENRQPYTVQDIEKECALIFANSTLSSADFTRLATLRPLAKMRKPPS